MVRTQQLDHLDQLALQVAGGNDGDFGVLSTGERLYVALAANRPDLLAADGYTVAQALGRLGDDWTRALVVRWQHRTLPRP